MSLIKADMDGDGDLDVLASDRRSRTPGVLWLENPGVAAMQKIPRNVGRRTAWVRLAARSSLSRVLFANSWWIARRKKRPPRFMPPCGPIA